MSCVPFSISLILVPFESSEFQLLIVNSYGIFEIEYSRMVRQCAMFGAIGTGEEYALGAISAVYDKIDSSQEIALHGLEAAAEFDKKTSLPAYVINITPLNIM